MQYLNGFLRNIFFQCKYLKQQRIAKENQLNFPPPQNFIDE